MKSLLYKANEKQTPETELDLKQLEAVSGGYFPLDQDGTFDRRGDRID